MPGKNNSYRILIVDHHGEDAEELASILRLYNFIVITAYTASGAILVAESWSPNLILAEVQLPGMDGFAMLEAIRALPGCSAVPAIAMHPSRFTKSDLRWEQAHFDASFSKPVPIQQLMALIESLLWSDRQSRGYRTR